MNRLFRTAVVEISGVRTIAGGGTNASNAGQALLNLSGVSITGDQTISGEKIFISRIGIGGNLDLGFSNFEPPATLQLSDNGNSELRLGGVASDQKKTISFYDDSVINFQIINDVANDFENLHISGKENRKVNFNNRPTVNGAGVLLSGEIPQNKKFIYSGAMRGTGTTSSIISYGANCEITPKHVGTVKAEACISMTCVGATSFDVQQTASFWYGTGTPPVYSGNLVSLNATRIGGLKGFHASTPGSQNTAYPVSASWVAEITGLATGTQYWFDIGMSGSRIRVQDIQLYIEEKY